MQVTAVPRSVVVGIDGSPSALQAALWAVDEAVCRDIPLRLIFAVDPRIHAGDAGQPACDLADAETAVRHACAVVESTGQPVKIEVDILRGRPTTVLLAASRSAAMLCVGSLGFSHSRGGPIGYTAATLATSAPCPVAIVHGHDAHPADSGWVVADLGDATTGEVVLRLAFDEARLRGAALRVVTTWQSGYTDIHDSHAEADRSRLARAELDRRLAKWTRTHPDVEAQSVAVHGNSIGYLTKNAHAIQLLVIGRERAHGIRELIGPPGYAALHHANCSVLIGEPQNVL